MFENDIMEYVTDGRLCEPNDGKRYRMREMADEAKRLGRPLTKKETRRFEKMRDSLMDYEYHLPPDDFIPDSLISKKDGHEYSVDRKTVNSRAYHDKFEHLPVSIELRQVLYKQAGRLLEFVDSLPKHGEERTIMVSSRDGKLVVDNFERNIEVGKATFTRKDCKKIRNCGSSMILLRNHPNNDAPSYEDLKTYYESSLVRMSLILGHDGTVYEIDYVSDMFLEKYSEFLAEFSQITRDEREAKRLATAYAYEYNERLPKSKKLFIVNKL